MGFIFLIPSHIYEVLYRSEHKKSYQSGYTKIREEINGRDVYNL